MMQYMFLKTLLRYSALISTKTSDHNRLTSGELSSNKLSGQRNGGVGLSRVRENSGGGVSVGVKIVRLKTVLQKIFSEK